MSEPVRVEISVCEDPEGRIRKMMFIGEVKIGKPVVDTDESDDRGEEEDQQECVFREEGFYAQNRLF
jgi:hypothetical protein